MIVCTQQNLQFPLTDDLYLVPGGRDSGPLYSASNFYFPSADFSRLVPAMADEERFLAALATQITNLAGLSCVPGLQAVLDALTADLTPPAPIYPEIGDVAVRGRVIKVYDAPAFIQLQSPTPPPDWHGDPSKWKGPLWCGEVVADIESNNYSTPPAKLVEAWSQDIGQFRFAFRSSTAVQCGPCTFDIVQGYDYTGAPSVPVARNVVNA